METTARGVELEESAEVGAIDATGNCKTSAEDGAGICGGEGGGGGGDTDGKGKGVNLVELTPADVGDGAGAMSV